MLMSDYHYIIHLFDTRPTTRLLLILYIIIVYRYYNYIYRYNILLYALANHD